MSTNLDLPPKPEYHCHFLSSKHSRSDEVIANVQAYMLNRWPFPSDKHREKYPQQDLELWISYIAPYALDQRVELTSLWVTFIFFMDDILENAPEEKAKEQSGRIIDIISGKTVTDQLSEVESIALELYSRFIALSQDASSQISLERLKQKSLECYQTTADSLERSLALENFNAYMKYRVTEAGSWMMFAIIFWASGVSLPSDLAESEHIRQLELAAGNHLIGINDLYSYRKESRSLGKQSSSSSSSPEEIMNCIPILMKERNLDYDAVVAFITDFLITTESRFPILVQEAKEAYPAHVEVIDKVAKCLEAFMAGNTIWSSTCRRYNALD